MGASACLGVASIANFMVLILVPPGTGGPPVPDAVARTIIGLALTAAALLLAGLVTAAASSGLDALAVRRRRAESHQNRQASEQKEARG